MKMFSKYSIYPCVVSILVFSGCKEPDKSPVVARVGNSELTVDDMYKSIPSEYSDQITREQNITYVKQWIDTELLYREALRSKLDKDKDIIKRLEKIKKDLLAAEIISRASSRSVVIDKDIVESYYNQHKTELIREKDVVKFLEIVVDSTQTAASIKTAATADNFSSLAVQHSKLPFSDSGAYVPIEDVQPEIRSVIESAKTAGIYGPVKTEVGYHVILLQEKLEKGGQCTLEEAWEEITTLLSTKAQKENLEKLLSDLRLKNDVEFSFDQLSGNTSDTSEIKNTNTDR